jgi:aminoglycoside 6'-N-acetyltransferase
VSDAQALVLQGTLVRLRLASPADEDRFVAILAHPDVARWWGRYDRERVRSEMIEVAEDIATFAVEAGPDHEVIGLIQRWEETEPDYRHAGIDVAIDPAWHRRGLGTDAVRTLARHCFEDLGHHRVTIDPAADNEPAIRSYRKVGFRPVGIMRQYERGLDGTWHDGLLMDLLPGELTPGPAPERRAAPT